MKKNNDFDLDREALLEFEDAARDERSCKELARALRANVKGGKRISLLEWSMRLNIMLIATMGRTMSSFCEDWKWEELYHEGFSAGEVVEAIVEEFKSLGVLNVEGQLVRVN